MYEPPVSHLHRVSYVQYTTFYIMATARLAFL